MPHRARAASGILLLALVSAPLARADDPDLPRYQACLAQIETGAEAAYEAAMAWAGETNALLAHRCAAAALVERGRPADAALRLERLAGAGGLGDLNARAELYAAAGAAWLAAERPEPARAALTEAVTLLAQTPQQLPDVLIDRAQALSLLGQWRPAEEDLNRALDIRAADALALRLRATARLRQGVFDLALADAERAAALAPADIAVLLTLGQARNAQRLGRAPE